MVTERDVNAIVQTLAKTTGKPFFYDHYAHRRFPHELCVTISGGSYTVCHAKTRAELLRQIEALNFGIGLTRP